MKTLTTKALDLALTEFVKRLSETPLENSSFTAYFKETGNQTGSIIFKDKRSESRRYAEWKAYIEDAKICADLLYNNKIVLFSGEAQGFIDFISERILVFS